MRTGNFPNTFLAYSASEYLAARYFPIHIQNYFQCQILLIDKFDTNCLSCREPSSCNMLKPLFSTVIAKWSAFHMTSSVAFLYAQEEHNKIRMCSITRMQCLPAVGRHLIWRRGIGTVGKDEMLILVQRSFSVPKVMQQHNKMETGLRCLRLFTWVLLKHLLN